MKQRYHISWYTSIAVVYKFVTSNPNEKIYFHHSDNDSNGFVPE